MLGLDFYRKIEKLMNKKYMKKCYHSDGYFCIDTKDSTDDHFVFNRIVSLKSSFKLPKK